MQLRQPIFIYSACVPFTKNKERMQKLKEQEIQNIFIRTNEINIAFSMIWLMDILRIFLEEQLLIKYYMLKYLNIGKNPKYDDIHAELFQWFINV